MLRATLLPTLTMTLLAATACGAESSSSSASPEGDARPAAAEQAATEASGPQPRLAVAYDGGVRVLDATTGDTLADVPLPGFLRLRPAGDGRHVLVAGEGGFHTLDLGAWTDSHGDHGHSWTGEPHLTGATFSAEEPGHVVTHHDRTVLFDDGTGTITSFDPSALEDGDPVTRTMRTPMPHHGVAIELEDGRVVHTLGTEEARTGAAVVDPRGRRVAASRACPGVHGEAYAAGWVLLGCEDGVLLTDGDTFRKVAAPDPYARIGNVSATEDSPIVLGDYKVDADAELERPTRVSLVDVRRGTLRLVDLGASYTFRSLGRGPRGEGLVLATDGTLKVVDMVRGAVTREIQVVEPWREPVEWQQPRPMLTVVDGTAYVSEPATRRLHVVDLARGKVTDTFTLDVVPSEHVAITG